MASAARSDASVRHARGPDQGGQAYYTDSMPWYAGNLGDILGHGVIAKAMAEAQALEKDFPKKIDLIFKAHRGETAWRKGDLGLAISTGETLLKGLPRETRLLRMRVRAWLADSYRQQGRLDEASTHYHQVLDFYPTVLRHLKIPVPVTFLANSGRTEEIRSRLEGSPRLVETSRQASLSVLKTMERHRASAWKARNFTDVPAQRLPMKEADDDPLAASIDRFHDQVFAPRIELTQSDINSLDGRAVRGDAKGAIDALLGKKKRRKRRTR